jgi:microcystin degradation protein MlrC
VPVFTVRRLAEAQGWEVVESLIAAADPSDRTAQSKDWAVILIVQKYSNDW